MKLDIDGIKPAASGGSPLAPPAAQGGSCGCAAPSPKSTAICCGPEPPRDMTYIEVGQGTVSTPVGEIPTVATRLTGRDHLGTFQARWGVRRMQYAVRPGLYAVGSPTPADPVLVSANYKMSLDRLRESLVGRDLWILVLDTRGINVWCAAGKGTFGTDELAARIEETGLAQVVDHRRVIVPQLGAPGVSGWRVKERTGFAVKFGPVEAQDLPAYLDGGQRATDAMRRKRFPIGERLALIPLEMVYGIKPGLLAAVFFFFAAGLAGSGSYWTELWARGPFSLLAFAIAVIAGSVIAPLLLPWIPFRSFSAKGAVVGLAAATGVLVLFGPAPDGWPALVTWSAWLLMIPALSSFLAMNFTGASTYTSLSGVKKEMRVAVPLQIGVSAVGLILWVAGLVGA